MTLSDCFAFDRSVPNTLTERNRMVQKAVFKKGRRLGEARRRVSKKCCVIVEKQSIVRIDCAFGAIEYRCVDVFTPVLERTLESVRRRPAENAVRPPYPTD